MDRTLCTLLSLLAVAGCGPAAKAPVHDTFSLVGGKASEANSIASIGYGATSKSIRTSGDYGWLQLDGHAGDRVDIWVRSSDGDAVAFLLDSHDDVVAVNDDADGDNSDAHLTAPLASDGVYYIAFREYSYARASFKVSVDGVSDPSCRAAAVACSATRKSDGC